MDRHNYIVASKMPRVSKEFALELRSRFPVLVPKPGTNLDALMFSGGEQRVVEFVLHHAQSSGIVAGGGEPINLVPIPKPSFIQHIRNYFHAAN